jgi:pimeloyl-ACP methyl ester carboxylesterase
VSGHDIVVDAGDIKLSGLLAEPAVTPPIAVVVAIPGSGMLGRYFDGPVDGAASLLTLGAAQGFTVWAIDRPGYGASADVPDDRIDIVGQAGLVRLALDAFAREHDIGAGFFVVGHSYGLKVALVMAADAGRRQLLGVDGAGTGLRYAIDSRRPPPRVPGERGPMWGPEHLYPPGTFASGNLPLARVPAIQASEAAAWPALLRSIAGDIRVPLQFTYGDHERLWPIDDASLAEVRAVFTGSPRVEIAIQPGAGHNVSLSNAAADYHTRALAFALTCSDGSAR